MDDARRQYERDRKRRYRAELRNKRLKEQTRAEVVPEPDLESIREYERERKRQYRQNVHTDLQLLREQVLDLSQELARRCTRGITSQQKALLKDKALVEQVRRQRRLLQLLQTWVKASIQPTLRENSPWLHSTLLADRDARQVGYKWLTDRVFHSAVGAVAVDSSVDDGAWAGLITGEDACDIHGIENTHQTTFFANYERVARVVWEDATDTTPRPDGGTLTVLAGDDRFRYQHIQSPSRRSTILMLARRYHVTHQRVVFVYVYIRDDECFPLEPDHFRPHGFGWTSMERITDDVTLCRTRTTQFANVTFEQAAARFRIEPHASQDVVLARMQNRIMQGVVAQAKDMMETINDGLTQLELKDVEANATAPPLQEC
ncbi:Aste57867_12569 [Aphanomyces stellatus]|uniref:Aste57867_12569 protein n=2 Tax=Aphanomyces stellatus TaxID=120398 RepID=A0A485KXA5_9STRA|nr:hypothetical protein As57867_012523 [Aphanomyces stellatus]VFT89420.1 Aste57867_12569 [Aphanomyces stellatus]